MMRFARTRPRRRREGFTLMEMMIVVIIIGVAAMLAAPAVHSARIEAKNNRAALDLVRLLHRARGESMMYGRAHLVRFNSATQGSFTVFRGTSTNCNTNTWGTMQTGPACGLAGSYCIDQLRLAPAFVGDSLWSIGESTLDVTSVPASGSVDICYEPTARMQWRRDVAMAVNGGFTDRNFLAGAFRFVFQRRDSGTAEGVPRTVIVPLGGEARLMQ